jgi:ABC-2 type transport system permease protein
MNGELRIVWEEFKKNLKILLCYPVIWGFWAIFPILWVLPLVFQGKALVGGLSSQAFENLTGSGNYLAFVLIGSIVSTYAMSSLWGMGQSLRDESYWGTLELILTAPIRPLPILIGKAMLESGFATVGAVIQAAIFSFFLGVELSFGKILPVLFVMVLLLLGLYGAGLALAAITLLIKESRGLVNTLNWVFYLFSPIRYPVEVNPITRIVSLAIPLTYALFAIRSMLLLNTSITELWVSVLLLILFDIGLIWGSYYVFLRVERRVRRTGTIGMY